MRGLGLGWSDVWRRSCVDRKLFDILVCPRCKGALIYNKTLAELVCKGDRLAYPIRDDIPIMLEDEARQLTDDEFAEIERHK